MSDETTYATWLKFLTMVMMLQISSSALAGERESDIIDRAVNAYGGEKLAQIMSIELNDTINSFSTGQSGHSAQGAMSTHFSQYHIEMAIDFHKKKKMLKHKTTMLVGYHDVGNETITHQIFADDEGYVVDHALQRYHLSKRINFQTADNGFAQMIDTLIIKQLSEERERSHWLDTAYIQGQANDVLVVNKGTKEQYTVYINQQTGYLSRMLLVRGDQIRSYDFLKHRKNQGLTWAKQLFVGTQEKALYYTDSRTVKFNSAKTDTFVLPKGYMLKEPVKWIDDSSLTIRELANGVYFVGQNWGYTLFVDAGDYYISAGAWHYSDDSSPWQDAVSLLRKTTGNNQPISQHLISHHHTDHMSGLRAVINEGANLVIHPSDVAAVNGYLKRPLADERLVLVEGGDNLAAGKVVIYDVPNSHASHNLVMYLPEHKILFTEDMFGSSLHEGFHSPNTWPSVDTYPRLARLSQKIEQLNLDVEQYVSSHHFRILNQSEVNIAMKVKRH